MGYNNNPDGMGFYFEKLSEKNSKDLKERNSIFAKIRKLKKLQDKNWCSKRHSQILNLQKDV
jgi:hypothetical protein